MTAEQIKALIEGGLACDHCEVEGDGRHWYATVVAAIHALSIKTYTPAEWAQGGAVHG